MKRLARNPLRYEVLALYEKIAREQNMTLEDAEADDEFLRQFEAAYRENKSNRILVYGKRTEALFGYVAASLGGCKIVKSEDAGEIIASDPTIQPPDYRLVLEDGSQMLVEVKNTRVKSFERPFSLRSEDVDALDRYGAVFGLRVWIAVYWSNMRMWTLVDSSRLRRAGSKCSLSLFDATKINEMAILGDMMIGVRPPLVTRVLADPKRPCSMDESGNVSFFRGGLEFYNGNRRIVDETERNLAYQFTLFSDWTVSEPRAVFEDGVLVGVEYLAEPEEWDESQGFAFVGSLSQLISTRFALLTAAEAGVRRISPRHEPGSLSILLPANRKSESLPLWRFIQRPNYD